MTDKCIGIIAEYNPFHNGHAHHLREAKRVSGAEHAIVCMSASFVQRGEPACADKFTRARWALMNGADMVIELPDALSCSNAERFAFGGVKLLSATGLVSGVCFGSESGDCDRLIEAASAVPDPTVIKAELDKGKSYPSALSSALSAAGVDISVTSPNDLLGIEYIRAAKRINPSLSVYAVRRVGPSYNDSGSIEKYASASAIRSRFGSGRYQDVYASMPSDVCRCIAAAAANGTFPAAMDNLSDSILYTLRKLGASGISELAEVSEGLENPLFAAALKASCGTDIPAIVKSKRYTHAKLRRILVNSLLGTTKELQNLAVNVSDSLFIRVLGVRRESKLLSELGRSASLPIVTRRADINKLPSNAVRIFDHTSLASSIRALACPQDKSGSDEFSSALIMV